jgi:hypothetical protein
MATKKRQPMTREQTVARVLRMPQFPNDLAARVEQLEREKAELVEASKALANICALIRDDGMTHARVQKKNRTLDKLAKTLSRMEAPKNINAKVAIFVNGGNVQEVRSDFTSIKVTLVDDDNDKKTMTVKQRDEKCAAVEADHPHSLSY